MPIVAIDGPTGVGKSTTARALAVALGVRVILDPVSASPLLDDYYNGEAVPDADLRSELAFLQLRADLMRNADVGEQIAVSDFTVARTGPFSEFLEDPAARREVQREMYLALQECERPAVLVLLQAEPTALHERVRRRDRTAESDLTIDHLDALVRHFAEWEPELRASADHLIVIDTANWNPLDPEDLAGLVARLEHRLEHRLGPDERRAAGGAQRAE